MIDVEPLIISELERMLPLPDGRRADWKDVLLRAGSADGRRIRARRLAFAAGQGEPHRWRRVLVAIVAVALLAGAGVAIAASFGVFRGIKAAQHPRTKADRLDPAVVASIISHNKQDKRLMHTSRGLLEPGSSRLVRQLPNGARVFAVAATGGELCVVMERMPRLASNMKPGGYTTGCTSPLTQKLPTTIESFRAWKKLGGKPPGIARSQLGDHPRRRHRHLLHGGPTRADGAGQAQRLGLPGPGRGQQQRCRSLPGREDTDGPVMG